MLTAEQKHANEIKFMELLSKLNVDLTNFNKFLDEVDFFNKPASLQYTRAYPGGLCEQTLLLANELGMLCNAYYPGRYTAEDILKVALFKDLYRAVMYEPYLKNVKDDASGQWMTVEAFKTKDGNNRQVFGELGMSSYMIAKRFFEFTDEQIEAIIYSKPSDFAPDIHDVMRQYPLVTLTRMAEMVTTYLN